MHDDSCITSPFEAIQQYNTGGVTQMSQGCDLTSVDKSGFDAAIALAKKADVVILFMGIDDTIEGEAHDRYNITFPGVQSDLAIAIGEVNR
eukprot:UN17536